MADTAYSDADRARRVPEAGKRAQVEGAPPRGDFERDRARVLHSSAFRRLADKTQVVVPGEDDFPRTRLTHSLEVAQIARELGAALGCDPDVTETAGLAHDLGHPPFGHNGEEALNAAAAGIGGFEGNAQTLRILTRLEPKALHEGRSAGLNLTRATLDATIKYPWPRPAEGGKFGVYADDRLAYDWIRAGRRDGERCLEAQVMDWADDVAYSVHDVEDGVHAGLIRLAECDAAARARLCALAATLYSPLTADELAPVLDALLQLPSLRDLAAFDGSFAALAAGKRVTSELTGRFAGAAVAATRAAAGPGRLTRYGADLVVPPAIAAECALLKAMAAEYVMGRPAALARRAEQMVLLTELVEALAERAPAGLDVQAADDWKAAADDAGRHRAVIDQVARLTDSAAVATHAALPRPAVLLGGVELAGRLDALETEGVRAGADDLEQVPTVEVLRRLVTHEHQAPQAVAAALPALAAAVDGVAARMAAGGRLIYVGAGTPGRLATLDAAECVPTFGLPPGRVLALMAGGDSAAIQAVEGAEDRADLAIVDLEEAALTAADAVVGITASGRTPYVVAALQFARQVGALTVGIANNLDSEVAAVADIGIELRTGAEVVSGSTRLTAGTAQKITLNALSTAVMVRLGKTYRGRMVDVVATNEKLRRRAVRIVAQLTDRSDAEVAVDLQAAAGEVKVAVVMGLFGLDAAAARARLAERDGRIG